eukprot:364189-Chlamydomonas_euryale.AAC.17
MQPVCNRSAPPRARDGRAEHVAMRAMRAATSCMGAPVARAARATLSVPLMATFAARTAALLTIAIGRMGPADARAPSGTRAGGGAEAAAVDDGSSMSGAACRRGDEGRGRPDVGLCSAFFKHGGGGGNGSEGTRGRRERMRLVAAK